MCDQIESLYRTDTEMSVCVCVCVFVGAFQVWLLWNNIAQIPCSLLVCCFGTKVIRKSGSEFLHSLPFYKLLESTQRHHLHMQRWFYSSSDTYLYYYIVLS